MVGAVRLAAVTYDKGFPIDDLLGEIANTLRAERIKVSGAIQQNMPGQETPCSAMVLEDLASNERTWISQELGSQARGCRLDPRGLVEVAARLDRAFNHSGDNMELLIVNKFGKAEAEGNGLRSVISRAIEAGIPVLTSVRPPYTTAWSEFHAGLAVELKPEREAVLAWCRASVQAVRAARRTAASPSSGTEVRA